MWGFVSTGQSKVSTTIATVRLFLLRFFDCWGWTDNFQFIYHHLTSHTQLHQSGGNCLVVLLSTFHGVISGGCRFFILSNCVSDRTMSLAQFSEDPGTGNYSQEILKKFQWAIKRVTNEHSNNKEASLTQDELIQLIRAWEPQRDIICLYVRWSRQLRRNFNLDSIATLLCLSRQCGYSPVEFLCKVKTLSIIKNQKAAYGVTFHFDVPNRKDVNRERLNKEFLGLSVTLALLQEQVTDSPSVLGKTGMRHTGPRTTSRIDIPVDSQTEPQTTTVDAHPNVEFHTQSSLLNRIWISINHRWLALYLIEHLFQEDNVPWSYQDSLVYSFQMMAPCGPSCFEYLSPLAGICMRFPSQESINANRTRLREIWNNPSSCLTYGNRCLAQFSSEAQSRIIIDCFQDP